MFIFIVVVWFVGLILRATFSRWLRLRTEEFDRAARRARKEANARGRREGDVIIEGTGVVGEKKVNRTVGEYVEFEEIENNTESK